MFHDFSESGPSLPFIWCLSRGPVYNGSIGHFASPDMLNLCMFSCDIFVCCQFCLILYTNKGSIGFFAEV